MGNEYLVNGFSMKPNQKITRLLGAALCSPLATAVAAIITATPAQADDGPAGDDPIDNYLFVLDSEGINPTNDSGAVTVGYALCDEIASGAMPRILMKSLAANEPDLSAYQVEVVVDSAVVWLCPEYLNQYLAYR